MRTITVAHVRAQSCWCSRPPTELQVITPQQAFHGGFDERGYRVLCTSTDLEDAGLRVGRDGQLVGPTVAVCAEVARHPGRPGRPDRAAGARGRDDPRIAARWGSPKGRSAGCAPRSASPAGARRLVGEIATGNPTMSDARRRRNGDEVRP